MTGSAAVAAALAFAGLSQAAVFTWNFNAGDPQPPGGAYEINSIGGTIHSITATFNDVTRQLSFTANFSDRVTRGFFLALNNGPLPRSRPGELGLFYFDANDVFDGDPGQNLFMTAYGYNGANDGSTWRDGDSVAPGDQAPDVVRSILDTSWISSLSAADVVLPGGINGRSLSFIVDASPIIAHLPLYPDSGGGSWFGTGFADLLGIWFHPFADLFDLTYDLQGRISGFNAGPQGSFDGFNFVVPAPGSAGALLAAGVLLAARRRR
ncbi:MAG: hypothetical protein ACK4WH_01450 [Phycisphaerales bacterium]